MLVDFILVGIGGGMGAFLRSFLSDIIKKKWHHEYPIATFLINVTGSFLLGILLHYHESDLWMLLFGTGVMGGYTTFSTFNYELISLIKSGKKMTFLVYYILSVICGLAAAALGVIL